MNKKALLEYALFARKELETQIALSLNKLGIYKDHITKANVVGDFTIIEGTQETFPKRVYELRKSIVENEFHLKNQKFDNVVEEFAYTWFNRIVAIRFMEVHDYFPHGFRVLTSRDGAYEPEIMKNLPYVLEELDLKESVIRSLKEQNKIEELYRYVLFKQCNRLSKVFPDLFNKGEEYLELLLPNNLLSPDSIIRKMESIPEEDFLNDVEIVGWLYQFYNSVKKDQVFASKETITKDTLPAVTQLFTPDWIVRYMAENSVGRVWMESYPNSSLRNDLKYYVDDAMQDDETNKKLEEIKYKNVDPEKIKVIEPCSGSGHILVYVFDLIYKMYLEKGYNTKDIPALILKNNLFGLDVDKRAAQLAQFSLIMKARSIDNRFFNEDRFVRPRVFEIIDSTTLTNSNYKECMKSLHFSDASIKIAEYLDKEFEHAKVIGSLLQLEQKDYAVLMDDIKRCREVEIPNLLEYPFFYEGINCLKQLVRLAMTLTKKYDVMITNPPYIGLSTLEAFPKKYLGDRYPNSKTDMFAMFMETNFVKKNGFLAMINMHSWMFLSSYEKLRKHIIQTQCIYNMLHLGAHAFETIGGEVVQTTSFVIRNCAIPSNGVYFRLVDEKDKEAAFLAGGGIIMNLSVYDTLPNNIIAYWVSENFVNIFKKSTPLFNYCEPKKGLSTGNNDLFLRLWHEVDLNKVFFDATDYISAFASGKKWFPINKGGSFRKWYGNNDFVINYETNGKELKKYSGSVIRNESYYFNESITWSMLSSSTLGTRFSPKGKIFEGAGPSLFIDEDKIDYILGLLSTKVAVSFVKSLNPTLNINISDIGNIPIVDINSNFDVATISKENVELSKEEWDSFEESWDFKKHPLL